MGRLLGAAVALAVLAVAGLGPLHVAVSLGSEFAVQQLAVVIDVNQKNVFGFSPLHVAAQHDRLDIARVLVDAGGDILATEAMAQRTPLQCHPNPSLEWQALLSRIEHVIDTDALTTAARSGHVAVLAQVGAQSAGTLGVVDAQGNTLAHVAAQSGQAAALDVVLRSAPGTATAVNALGNTPLHEAALANCVACAKRLLAAGADVHAMGNRGQPIHVAAERGGSELVHLLAEHGALPSALDSSGSSPLHKTRRGDVARTLLALGANPNHPHMYGTPLHPAASFGRMDVLQALLARGAKVDGRDDDLSTALHKAARNAEVDTLRVLVHNGATVDAETSRGWTPLMSACVGTDVSGVRDAVRFLLHAGSDPRAAAHDGRTPVHWAAFHNNVAALQEMLAHARTAGAPLDVDVRDEYGHTPLALAVLNNHADVARVLVAEGADPEAENRGGTTPRIYSLEKGRRTWERILGPDPDAEDE